MSIFVTGFGAFGNHEENPSSVLARSCGEQFCILPVSWVKVEEFLASGTLDKFDSWLMIGVHGSATKFHLETRAKNWIGTHPDIDGIVHGPAQIDPRAPFQLSSTIWKTDLHHIETDYQHPTIDAGDYLCNYTLFRGLQTFPEKKMGFLHIPTFERMSERIQTTELVRIIRELKN